MMKHFVYCESYRNNTFHIFSSCISFNHKDFDTQYIGQSYRGKSVEKNMNKCSAFYFSKTLKINCYNSTKIFLFRNLKTPVSYGSRDRTPVCVRLATWPHLPDPWIRLYQFPNIRRPSRKYRQGGISVSCCCLSLPHRCNLDRPLQRLWGIWNVLRQILPFRTE